MFTPSTLPPPPSYGRDPRPLRLTSELSRPQPQGGCHYQSSSHTGQKCLCQTYHHDRALPGNTCDCGHSACYHSPTSTDRTISPDRIVSALVDKVKKLEEVVIKERESRNNILTRERQIWEREARVLREALAPFYQSESDMKKKLTQLENRLNNNYDEQTRIKDRIVAIDDASITLRNRVERYELAQGNKKRKASLSHEMNGVLSPRSNYTYSSSSAASDTTSTSTQRSPQPCSPTDIPAPTLSTFDSPRSSGVLNLNTDHIYGNPRQRVAHNKQNLGVNNEPRSSGFLSIDLAERLRRQKIASSNNHGVLETKKTDIRSHKLNHVSHELPSPPPYKAGSGAMPLSSLLAPNNWTEPDRSAKRYKPETRGMMALEVLANVTVDQTVA